VFAQSLRDEQHEIGRGTARRERPDQMHSDHSRQRDRVRNTEQDRFGIQSAHAPAEHAQAVDHRRVRIGADDEIRGEQRPLRRVDSRDDAGDVLEIDLVDDAGARREDPQVAERGLRPLDEVVALAVAIEFPREVQRDRLGAARMVHLQ
jgi:hypothetical protein